MENYLMMRRQRRLLSHKLDLQWHPKSIVFVRTDIVIMVVIKNTVGDYNIEIRLIVLIMSSYRFAVMIVALLLSRVLALLPQTQVRRIVTVRN